MRDANNQKKIKLIQDQIDRAQKKMFDPKHAKNSDSFGTSKENTLEHYELKIERLKNQLESLNRRPQNGLNQNDARVATSNVNLSNLSGPDGNQASRVSNLAPNNQPPSYAEVTSTINTDRPPSYEEVTRRR